MVYTIRVTETFQRDVLVRADSEREAVIKVNDDWENASLILAPDCTQGIVTHVIESTDEWSDEQRSDPDWSSYQKSDSEYAGIKRVWREK